MIQRLGDGALRIPRPKGKSERAILSAARAWPSVVDACLTEAWLAVYFEDGTAADVDPQIVSLLDALGDEAEASRLVEIPVRYDGADLDEVARTLGMSVEGVVSLHTNAEYTVLFLGFMPGFAYLGGLPRALEMPRLASPRTRVPRNAVAIAGHYTGIYPFESPGGWRLLGTATNVALFDLEQGAYFRPGDRVRFHAVGF